MNGLVKAAQPFAGMDLLWESGRRAGQVFLSTPQSAVWVTEGLLVLPFVFQAEDLPGWIWPQLGDCLHLVWAVSAAWVWGCGAWLQQCRGGLSERGKGVLLQGFCQSITPRCLWVCWGWFYESSSAFTTCCWLWEARSSGQGEMGTVAAASTDSGVGLMCNHSHPLHPLLSPWGWAPGLPCHEQTLSKERLFYRGFTHSE